MYVSIGMKELDKSLLNFCMSGFVQQHFGSICLKVLIFNVIEYEYKHFEGDLGQL